MTGTHEAGFTEHFNRRMPCQGFYFPIELHARKPNFIADSLYIELAVIKVILNYLAQLGDESLVCFVRQLLKNIVFIAV